MDRDGGPGDAALGFESLDGEVEVDSLDVEGNVPSWLEGSLYRNGPACFEVDGRSLEHWFDGYAMLHLFDFEDGDVAYANRYLDTDAYRSSRDDGMTYAEFATDPCRDLFERVFSFFLPPDPTDNANVNVTKVAEEYVAMTETPLPVEFDPESLETLGVADYERHLDGHLTTAHPHHDGERGLTYNYVTEIGPRSTYRLSGVDDDGGSTEVGSRRVGRPSYMHSFGMTEDHLVLSEWPLVVDPLSLVLGNSPFVSSYRWKPERGTWFTVFDKDSGEVVARCHDDRPAFAFHHVNAFERDGEFVVDVALYDDASVIDELYLDRLRSEEGPEVDSRLARYTLDPGSNEASYEVVTDDVFELPRFDYARRAGVEYGFAYGVGRRGDGFLDALLKVDVESGEAVYWSESGCYPGEPVFVERPGSSAEDDGVVLSVVLDSRERRSFLLVLDAESMDEVGRALAPHVVPHGFHGEYFE